MATPVQPFVGSNVGAGSLAFDALPEPPVVACGDTVLVAVGFLGWHGGRTHMHEPGVVEQILGDVLYVHYPKSTTTGRPKAHVWTHKKLVHRIMTRAVESDPLPCSGECPHRSA